VDYSSINKKMKIFKTLILTIFFGSFCFAQELDENDLKCSHSKTAISFHAKPSKLTSYQKEYDAVFYDINLKIDPNTKTIDGQVGVKGVAKVESFNMVDLNLSSVLSVESVKSSIGKPLTFSHDSNILSIILDSPIGVDEEFNIIVNYNGQPQATGLGSFGFNTVDGEPMIWSLSEPYGARDWLPCKDTNLDKADSVNITLTVPENLIAASNGSLVNTETVNNWTTYYWQERYPIATYLVSIAIHPYTVFYDWYKYSTSDSMRLEYYVFPDSYNDVQNNYALTKDMIAAMALRFGEYPFIEEKYGHAEFVWGGGMEHQTLTSLGGHSEGLIAHELGHQWWGDMVTCASFHHIWLNEGLATYSEALWYEIRDNDIQSLHNEMANNRYYYLQYPRGKNGGYDNSSIYVTDTTSTARIFDGSLTYAKAAWVVHMLRHVVGDDNFFKGLLGYREQYKFKSATTEQFQTVMEEVSTMDLEYFFDRWIYGEYYPIYDVVYNQSDDGLLIKVTQTQESEVFEMPIDILINFNDGSSQVASIFNSSAGEYFSIDVNNKIVANIEFDPDDWILKKVESVRLDTLDDGGLIDDFILFPSYPNPFNSETAIKFNLHKGASIAINIYNLDGSKIWTYSESYNPGIYIVNWNGIDNKGNKVPTGTYFVEVSNDKTVKSNKVLLLK